MKEFYAYHVVTDRPMEVGQKIIFDENNHSGVYKRVMEKLPIVEQIYKNPQNYTGELEHHTMVALRELALEEVRKQKFPNYPSRMAALYVSEQLEDAKNWCDLFVKLNRPTYSIVKLKINGNKFIGDANNCFKATSNKDDNLKNAQRYWLNLENESGANRINEILVDGEIEVVEIVEVINKNLDPSKSL